VAASRATAANLSTGQRLAGPYSAPGLSPSQRTSGCELETAGGLPQPRLSSRGVVARPAPWRRPEQRQMKVMVKLVDRRCESRVPSSEVHLSASRPFRPPHAPTLEFSKRTLAHPDLTDARSTTSVAASCARAMRRQSDAEVRRAKPPAPNAANLGTAARYRSARRASGGRSRTRSRGC